MKRLTYLAAIAAILIISLGPAQAQTNAEILAAYNEGVCDAFGLGDGCTDIQVRDAYCASQPQPCVDNRKADQKIYAAFAAFAAAVLSPERGKAIFEQRKNVAAAALNRAFLNANKAQCIAILQAAGITRVAVCG